MLQNAYLLEKIGAGMCVCLAGYSYFRPKRAQRGTCFEDAEKCSHPVALNTMSAEGDVHVAIEEERRSVPVDSRNIQNWSER